MDCEFIATGHYAKIKQNNGRYYVSKGLDPRKDQSYVLWGLSQECMERTIFPLADYTKDEIRQMAFDWGYEALSKKPESYEICFVPDNDYRGFLKRRVPGLEESVSGGKFVDKNGELLGTHDGYPFYTIGQRKGLGGGFKKPMYVTEIHPESNTVVLGEADELLKNALIFSGVNHQKYEAIPDGREFVTMVRYNDRGTLSEVQPNDDGSYIVHFKGNVRGVAPGQSAVVYEGEDVVAGGIIQMPQ